MEKEVKDICKILPRIIKDLSSSIIKGILDRIRRYVPKAFFKIIKARIGSNKADFTAKTFRDKVENGVIIKEISIASYLKDFYKDIHGWKSSAKITNEDNKIPNQINFECSDSEIE
jgi:hypothetical protein